VFYSWYGLFVLGVGQKPKLISGKKKAHWVHKLRKTFGLVTRCLAENLEHRIKMSIGEELTNEPDGLQTHFHACDAL